MFTSANWGQVSKADVNFTSSEAYSGIFIHWKQCKTTIEEMAFNSSVQVI